jgi:ferric-dicitrate binding protein FerR (iron transport regulator)
MSDKYSSEKYFLLDERFQQWVKSPDKESNAYWLNFLQEHPEARQAVEKARNIIQQLDFEGHVRSKTIKNSVKSRIDEAIAQEDSELDNARIEAEDSPYRRIHASRYWIGVAASIIFILLAGGYFLLQPDKGTTYATDFGETRTVILPDESRVRLNANSRVTLAENEWQDASKREVWLEGEAYFEVKKYTTKAGGAAKFIVHSGKVDVEVLGTEFNVNTRHRQTSVVLSSGKVKLNIEKQEVLMSPGEMVEVNERNEKIEKKKVDPLKHTSWTENRLIFDNTPLLHIKKLLEDNYGFEVIVPDSDLLKKEFTGDAPADDIAILLDKLSIIYNLNIIKNETRIRIENK